MSYYVRLKEENDRLRAEIEYAYRVVAFGFEYSSFDFSVLRKRAEEFLCSPAASDKQELPLGAGVHPNTDAKQPAQSGEYHHNLLDSPPALTEPPANASADQVRTAEQCSAMQSGEHHQGGCGGTNGAQGWYALSFRATEPCEDLYHYNAAGQAGAVAQTERSVHAGSIPLQPAPAAPSTDLAPGQYVPGEIASLSTGGTGQEHVANRAKVAQATATPEVDGIALRHVGDEISDNEATAQFNDLLDKARDLERRLDAAEDLAREDWLRDRVRMKAVVEAEQRAEAAEARLQPEALRAVLIAGGIHHSVGTLNGIIRAITGGGKP